MEEAFQDRLREACARLAEAHALVIEARPESLKRGDSLLADALAGVRAVTRPLGRGEAITAAGLQREAFRLRRLLENAASFYLRAMGSSGTDNGLYTPTGGLPAAEPVHRLVMEA